MNVKKSQKWYNLLGLAALGISAAAVGYNKISNTNKIKKLKT